MRRERKELKFELPYYGQIPTTKRTIIHHMWNVERFVACNTVKVIAAGREHPQYKPVLFAVSYELYYISKMVYRGKEGYTKLPPERYDKELFIGCAETKEEVGWLLQRNGEVAIKDTASDEKTVEYVYDCLQKVKANWCHMISLTHEQARIPILAYAMDYVLQRHGAVPLPEFPYRSALFPCNYEDYNYSEEYDGYFRYMSSGLL